MKNENYFALLGHLEYYFSVCIERLLTHIHQKVFDVKPVRAMRRIYITERVSIFQGSPSDVYFQVDEREGASRASEPLSLSATSEGQVKPLTILYLPPHSPGVWSTGDL